MTDIAIRIKSTYDGAGTASARKDIDALAKAAQGIGGGKSPDDSYDKIGTKARAASAGVQQLQRAQAGLEVQQARLAAAQGDGGRAAELMAQAERRLEATLAQTNATTTQTIAAQKQLAGIQTQVAKSAQEGSGYFSQMGTAMSSSLMGIVGPAAIAATAISAVRQSLDFAQAGASIQAIEQSFRSLAQTGGQSADELLSKMRAAAQGTISDAKLMESANVGLLLTSGKMGSMIP